MSDIDEQGRVVQSWARYAEDDLIMARHALAAPEASRYRLVAHLSQQCAEKYLKACVILQGVDPPHTHHIGHLVHECSERVGWPVSLEEADELTRHAVTTRYPKVGVEVSEAEAVRALELAERVREAVRRELRDAGLALGEDSQQSSPADPTTPAEP